jgi:hypothetical protein
MTIYSLTETIAKDYYGTSRSVDHPLRPLGAPAEEELQRNAQNFLVGLKRDVDRAGTLQPGLFASRNEGTAAANDIVKSTRQRCLDNSQRNRPALLKAVGRYTDEDPEIVVNRLNQVLPTAGHVTMNFHAHNFDVDAFAQFGGMRNAHSKGQKIQGGIAHTNNHYMNERRAVENKLFDLEKVAQTSRYGDRIPFQLNSNEPNPKFSPHAMPCYGAFSLDGEPDSPLCKWYGRSKITLKPSVLSNCFMTVGDTFLAKPEDLCSSETMADLVLHAHRGGYPKLAASLVQSAGFLTKPGSDAGRRPLYIDTQIFGGVSQSDMERIDLSLADLARRFPDGDDLIEFAGQFEEINASMQAAGHPPIFFYTD